VALSPAGLKARPTTIKSPVACYLSVFAAGAAAGCAEVFT